MRSWQRGRSGDSGGTRVGADCSGGPGTARRSAGQGGNGGRWVGGGGGGGGVYGGGGGGSYGTVTNGGGGGGGSSSPSADVTGYDSTATPVVTIAPPCTRGNYSTTGFAPCTAASEGYYVSGSQATSQTKCSAGSYQDQTGQTGCKSASIGYYVASAGAVSATACPAGETTAVTGSTSVSDCIEAPRSRARAQRRSRRGRGEVQGYDDRDADAVAERFEPGWWLHGVGAAVGPVVHRQWRRHGDHRGDARSPAGNIRSV